MSATFLIVALAAIWLNHSAILKYLLIESVDSISQGQMSLAIKSVDYHPFKKSFKVFDFALKVNDSLDDSKNTSGLQSLSLDSVVINEFSIWELLSARSIKADKVLTAQPKFVFNHLTVKDTALSIKKQLEILSTLNLSSLIKVDLDVLEVELGRIELKSDTLGFIEASADFWLRLHDFNTVSNTLHFDTNSFLYSKRIVIDASNVFRKLKNNRVLKVGNIEFDSEAENLIISKLSISSNTNGLLDKFYVDKLSLDGISLYELGNLGSLGLNSVSLDSAYFGIYPFRGSENPKPPRFQISTEFIALLKTFKVDKLMLGNINVDGFDNAGNKVLGFSGISVNVDKLSIDSSNFETVCFPDFKNFILKIKNIAIDTVVKLSSRDINYSFINSRLTLKNIQLHDKKHDNTMTCNSLDINGLNLERLVKAQKSDVSIKLYEPGFNLRPTDLNREKRTNINSGKILNSLVIRDIEFINADLNMVDENGLALKSEGINAGIVFSRDITIDSEIKLGKSDSLYWSSPMLNIRNDNKGFYFSAKSTSFSNNDLIVEDGILKSVNGADAEEYAIVGWHDMVLRHTSISKLLDDELISARKLEIRNINIDYSLKNNSGVAGNEAHKKLLPFSIDINELDFSDGNINIALRDETTIKKVYADFNLGIYGLQQAKNFDLYDIARLNFVSNIKKFAYSDENYEIDVADINYNSSDSSLKLGKINFNIDNFANESVEYLNGLIEIENLGIEQIAVLDFLQDNELYFNRLVLDRPHLKISFIEKTENNNSQKLNFDKSKVIKFNMLDINDLSAEILGQDNSMPVSYSIENADISWKPLPDNSRLDELDIDLRNFILINEHENLRLKINHINTRMRNDDIAASGISFTKALSDSTDGFSLQVPKLNIYDALLISFNEPRLKMRKLITDSLKFEQYSSGGKRKRLTKPLDVVGVIEQIDDDFFVEYAEFNNSALRLTRPLDTVPDDFGINDFDLKIRNAVFSLKDTVHKLPNLITLDLKDNKILIDNGLYTLKSGLINFDFVNNSIVIDTFSILPNLNMQEFFKRASYQTDMFIIRGGKVVMSDLNLFSFINDRKYLLGKIDLNKLNATIHRDKKYEIRHDVRKPMPAELIKLIKPGFYIDTINVHDAKILYGEYVNKSSIPGEVYFDKLNLIATRLTNLDSMMLPKHKIEINLNAMLMGKARLNARILVPLDASNTFSFSGKTEPMDFKIFNSMTENLFGVSIIKGRGSFDISGIYANDSISKGKIKFKYKKLRIGLYDREKATMTKGIASPFFKFLVNDLLIKSNNPRLFGNTREGLVYYGRDSERSFLNYMWKSLLSGILSTMWHNSKEQRKEKRRMKKLNKTKS